MGVYRDFDTHPRHFSRCVRDTTHMDTKFGQNVSNRLYFKFAKCRTVGMAKILAPGTNAQGEGANSPCKIGLISLFNQHSTQNQANIYDILALSYSKIS